MGADQVQFKASNPQATPRAQGLFSLLVILNNASWTLPRQYLLRGWEEGHIHDKDVSAAKQCTSHWGQVMHKTVVLLPEGNPGDLSVC